ncbi:PLP-dependent aminotransferase family protein [Pseudomonas putida]|uniref:PLP-dependent aminotransferase family protein n=1 Tax=Pseudomonas putida TaxID=303 RepID=A0AAD0PFB1_PSEPU|nr:PLP-dependent aminotransferase family protein [Pseudomonas putida]AXA24532.1 PLP-dependent aminotransferase family protein [Pseudomonas putida]
MDLQQLKPSREHTAPIYLQLYQRYREAIAKGKLRAGDRVPSVRSLASELNLARGTVEMAYQMLVGEGYFITRGAAGTRVAPGLCKLSGSAQINLEQAAPSPQQKQDPRTELPPFRLGLPALDAFPRKTWARLAARHLRGLDNPAMITPPPAGHTQLRRAIATYLGISRGINCSHEQVFVTNGYRGALDLVCRTLLRPGDLGWYEDPGYLHARQCLEHLGMRLQPVAVDRDGLDVAQGRRLAAQARFAVVTPTHQSPMGVALSLQRRLDLLDWAMGADAWIVEDDYDSEFRYHGRPLPALKSLDREGRVLYTGTFSKVLYPGLRLAYLVVPISQVERFNHSACHLPGPGAIAPQATVAQFMEQGHFARHLNKMRKLYASRRGYLVDALQERLGTRLSVQQQAGGIHVLAHILDATDERLLASSARAEGMALHALGEWRAQPSPEQGLLMGFANFICAEDAMAAVSQLEAVWKALDDTGRVKTHKNK